MATFLSASKTVLRVIGRFFRDADIFLLAMCIISALYGIVLIISVTASFEGGSRGYITTQVNAFILGIFAFILFSYIDIDIIADRLWLLFAFSLLFIASLYIWGQGEEETGNRAWLRFWGFGIQPAEVVKIIFAIIIAKLLVNYKEKKTLNAVVSVFQIALVFGSIFALIIVVSYDLGNAIVYAFMLIIMMFIAGVRLRWFAIGAVGITLLTPFIFPMLAGYQQERILAPFRPNEFDPDRQGVLWQANQSVRAITNGRFSGQGLGNGELTQIDFIPHQHTDFIFTVAGEELGFIGSIAIIFLLSVIIIRFFYVGIRSNSPLGMLVCVGMAANFMAQMVENIGMCLGLLPVIGITLPFFSYGGSSLVTCMAAAGIVSGVKMRPNPGRIRNYYSNI